MTVQGLEQNYYLINNPIYLRIFDVPVIGEDPKNYELTITVGSRIITSQMYNGEAMIDISPIVKSQFPKPNFQTPNSNRITIDITVFYYDEDLEQGVTIPINGKTFIRGGQYGGQNNYLSDGTILKVSEKIPVWDGLPSSKYTITGTNIIKASILEAEQELMKKHSCEGAYLLFKNQLGGYSTYYFNTFTLQESGESQEYIDTFPTSTTISAPQNNFYQFGSNSKMKLTVESRFDKRHYGILMSLINSPEVWVYEFHKLMDSDFIVYATNDWTKLINNGNNISIESGEETYDASLTFDLNLTKDNRLNA